jgi:hypothetical protein
MSITMFDDSSSTTLESENGELNTIIIRDRNSD